MTKPPISTQKAQATHLVCLGVITTAHGIRGAVRIKTFTESPENLTLYGPLQDTAGKLYKIRIIDIKQNDLVLATIFGISTRNQAEDLRGIELFIERSKLPNTDEEEYYHLDLISLKVVDLTGQEIGVIKSVHNFGAGDILEIALLTGQHRYIPFRTESVPTVSIKDKFVEIDPTFLLDETVKKP